MLQPGGAGSASADAASDLPLTVPALDFLEHSYHLVHLLDTILAHHQSTTASSAAASSASTPVCQSRLNCFGMDWRQVWQQRFVCHWLQSTTLALIHPMLLECLWRIFGATKMQTQAIEGFKLDGTMQEDAGAPAAAAASA